MSETDILQKLSNEQIIDKIYYLRGYKVMLDSDLAKLYGVATKVFNQAVKRNLQRFPDDFMFVLNQNEVMQLKSRHDPSKKGKGGNRYLPMAFTEQGVAMLSSVLSSEKAIHINIQIVRVFTRMRQLVLDNTELRLALEEIKSRTENNTKNIEVVFQYLDELIEKQEYQEPMPSIGFQIGSNNPIV